MTASTPDNTGESSFEESLEQLDGIVAELESGKLSLDDLISRYESGMKLVASCQQRLTAAELRVTEIAADHTDDAES